MSALDLRPVTGRSPLVWSALDGWVLCRRNLVKTFRAPRLLIAATAQPVILVLLFSVVFGGAFDMGPGLDYGDFVVPGVFVQAAVLAAATTGVGLAEDRRRGMDDRFRSLPMSRGALLTGRTLADLLRNTFVLSVMTIVGLAVGFRFGDTTASAVLAGFALVLLFAYAFSWVSAAVGLALGSAEAAQVATFVWLFPLTFMSSAFVPVDRMPPWLQPFAEHQPVTSVVDATRALFLGGPVAAELVAALAWCAGILAVFAPLAVHTYRRTSPTEPVPRRRRSGPRSGLRPPAPRPSPPNGHQASRSPGTNGYRPPGRPAGKEM